MIRAFYHKASSLYRRSVQKIWAHNSAGRIRYSALATHSARAASFASCGTEEQIEGGALRKAKKFPAQLAMSGEAEGGVLPEGVVESANGQNGSAPSAAAADAAELAGSLAGTQV